MAAAPATPTVGASPSPARPPPKTPPEPKSYSYSYDSYDATSNVPSPDSVQQGTRSKAPAPFENRRGSSAPTGQSSKDRQDSPSENPWSNMAESSSKQHMGARKHHDPRTAARSVPRERAQAAQRASSRTARDWLSHAREQQDRIAEREDDEQLASPVLEDIRATEEINQKYRADATQRDRDERLIEFERREDIVARTSNPGYTHIGVADQPAEPTPGIRVTALHPGTGQCKSGDPRYICRTFAIWNMYVEREYTIWKTIHEESGLGLFDECVRQGMTLSEAAAAAGESPWDTTVGPTHHGEPHIVGANIRRHEESRKMRGGGWIICDSKRTAKKLMDFVTSYDWPSIGGGTHRFCARWADRGCIPKSRRNRRDEDLWNARWEEELIFLPHTIDEVDRELVSYGLDRNRCAFCWEFGHRRDRCPTLRWYLDRQQNYVCGVCAAINHLMIDCCVRKRSSEGFFNRGR